MADHESIDPQSKGHTEHEKGGCDRPNLECLICNHEACGWCPDCSPGVPEWD